jgi:diguanylate cyclase (GGDEF)-like protein
MSRMPLHAVAVSEPMLDRLLPMHVEVTATGHIRHAGPTLGKVAGRSLRGERFLEAFEVRRPRHLSSVADLVAAGCQLLTLVLRSGGCLPMKGIAVATADGGLLVNLSFGITVVEAISAHGLAGADFAPTDLTVEMMYLAEARSAVTREAMKLNDRLDAARRVAEAMARSDDLTGLANRRAFDEELGQMLRRRMPFAMLHIDLDFFKAVNDTLGHTAGDAVLTKVAKVLRACTRDEDFAARIGGDEFMLLCHGLTDPALLAELGWRIITALEQPLQYGRRSCRISASIGITTTDAYAEPDADAMLKDADAELYASKRAGRALVSIHGHGPQPRPAAPEAQRG